MKIKKFESINVVPFIDIMLVLLVIVLTTATFVAKGIIPVELPNSKSAAKQEEIKNVTITIKENGDIFFEDTKVLLADIDSYISKYEAKTPININCDKEAKFDMFVALLDTLKEKNFNNIGIVTKKRN
ncbi:biopolymer transporter ExbD [bacterium]|nr:biopolymer transporter ExbD [bacterium]MBU1883319.1 biopolymer transporter ExbD [bacterium]